MDERTFDDFALYLKQRRMVGYLPPVLLLGAGASLEAGVGTMQQLFEFAKVKDFEAFSEYIKSRTPDERYLYLSGFLQTQKPAEVTPGYQALAALIAENYFDLVLSTNFDPLLEDALANARLWRKDYLLLINGVTQPNCVELILKERSPRVKIVKLHGDLFHRIMAWTETEMQAFAKKIKKYLLPNLYGRDIVIVGYSMSDKPIRELVLKAGSASSSIWYMHPFKIPDSLSSNPRVRAVIHQDCKFENLFVKLVKELEVSVPKSKTTEKINAKLHEKKENQEATIDDLMEAVVAVILVNDKTMQPFGSAFVLANPRIIVFEDFAGRVKEDVVKLRTNDQRIFLARVIKRTKGHPFAPVILEVPDEMKVAGLQLASGSLNVKDNIRVGVAAGEQIGISSGYVLRPKGESLSVAPIGKVNNLVPLHCMVAPGSSGAPVVNDRMKVIGYIVAGNTTEPLSYMYPAHEWGRFVQVTRKKEVPKNSLSVNQ